MILTSRGSGKSDGLHRKTPTRLVKFTDDFKSLRFAGDREKVQQLVKVRGALLSRSAGDYR